MLGQGGAHYSRRLLALQNSHRSLTGEPDLISAKFMMFVALNWKSCRDEICSDDPRPKVTMALAPALRRLGQLQTFDARR
jgi:hypothetical protein